MEMILVHLSVFFILILQVVCHEESNKSVCDICQCGYSSQSNVITLVNCSHMYLNDTSIPNTFPNTTEYLNLGFNSILYLRDSTFRGLFSLHVLDLQCNYPLYKIETGCFDDLTSLVELNLSYTSLMSGDHDLDPNIFLMLSKLEIIDTRGMFAETFPDKMLSVLGSLTTLTMSMYSCNFTFGEGFRNLTKLSFLYIDARDISVCTTLTLRKSDVANLQYNNLQRLEIKNSFAFVTVLNIESGLFSSFPKLSFLDLSDNQLTIDSIRNITYGLWNTNITTLVIDRVTIFVSPVFSDELTFEHLKNTTIQQLYMRGNSYVGITEDFVNNMPETLKEIYMDNTDCLLISINNSKVKNQLLKLEVVSITNSIIPYYDDLTPLYPSHGVCATIIPTYSSVTKIQWVPPNIKHLNASKCSNIYTISIGEMMFTKNSMVSLDVSFAKISSWKGPVFGLETLQTLNISNNNMDYIHYNAFVNTSNVKLTHMYMQHNNLGSSLNRDYACLTFSELPSLQYIDLSTNKIKTLKKCLFLQQRKLQILLLRDNAMIIIDISLQALSVRYLDVSNNVIESLTSENMNDIDKIKRFTKLKVNLGNNTLQCACNTKEFLWWFSNTLENFEKYQDYNCAFTDGRNIKLKTTKNVQTIAYKMKFKCMANTIIIVCIFIFIGLTMLLAFPVLVRFKWSKLQYLYHVTKRNINPYLPLTLEDHQRNYDVFISCSTQSNMFLNQFANYLDSQNINLTMYNPEVEAHSGRNVRIDSIQPIRESCCILALLDTEYMYSEKQFEFTLAIDEGIRRKQQCLIIVLMENIDNSCVPEEILIYCKNNSSCYIYKHDQIGELFSCLKHDIMKFRIN